MLRQSSSRSTETLEADKVAVMSYPCMPPQSRRSRPLCDKYSDQSSSVSAALRKSVALSPTIRSCHRSTSNTSRIQMASGTLTFPPSNCTFVPVVEIVHPLRSRRRSTS